MPRNKVVKKGLFFSAVFNERLQKPFTANFLACAKQHIPKALLHKAIPNPPIAFWGTGAIEAMVEDQFVKYTYPLPKEEGGTEIHMIWTDTPCRATCWNGGNETIEAMRNPKIECIIAQHLWLENDCLFADIILPANTTLEVEDILVNVREGVQFQSAVFQEQAIKPIGESKSDFEIVGEIAKKLGMYEEVMEGWTADELKNLFLTIWGYQILSAGKSLKKRAISFSRLSRIGSQIRLA